MELIDSLNFLLFIVSFFILIKRFKLNVKGTILNPLFYLCILSVLYLLLPTFYVEYALLVQNISISAESIFIAKVYSFWYTLIFLIFYLFSKDYHIDLIRLKLSVKTYNITLIIWLVITLLLVFIILLYFREIYSVKDQRVLALSLYETKINGRFKLRILLYLHICIMFMLYNYKRSLFFLLPCLLYLIIDYSHGGRTMSLMIILYLYVISVLQTGKHYMKSVLIVVIILSLSAVIQRGSLDSSLFWTLYLSAAEFSNTYITTLYVVDHPNIYIQSGFEYIIVSMSKVFPGGFVDKILFFGEWYGDRLSEQIGLGYGLAGNLITEALVYGGRYWAILNPCIIGTLLLFFNRIKMAKSLWGFFFILIIIITMQNITRSYFYGFIFYPIQILVMLFWSIGISKKNVIKIYS